MAGIIVAGWDKRRGGQVSFLVKERGCVKVPLPYVGVAVFYSENWNIIFKIMFSLLYNHLAVITSRCVFC